jgi:hypothetical protein
LAQVEVELKKFIFADAQYVSVKTARVAHPET